MSKQSCFQGNKDFMSSNLVGMSKWLEPWYYHTATINM